MYPLGFLFGLSFDTATEVGLLAISATQASHHLGLWSIMVFPALFTAGMALVDTSDAVLMVGAYGWAFVKPKRKLIYNLIMTLISVAVAVIVAVLEALNLAADRFTLDGNFWRSITELNNHFGALGVSIIVVFVAIWVISAFCARTRRKPRSYASAALNNE
jgi:high-affinity nickel-transport protein